MLLSNLVQVLEQDDLGRSLGVFLFPSLISLLVFKENLFSWFGGFLVCFPLFI